MEISYGTGKMEINNNDVYLLTNNVVFQRDFEKVAEKLAMTQRQVKRLGWSRRRGRRR